MESRRGSRWSTSMCGPQPSRPMRRPMRATRLRHSWVDKTNGGSRHGRFADIVGREHNNSRMPSGLVMMPRMTPEGHLLMPRVSWKIKSETASIEKPGGHSNMVPRLSMLPGDLSVPRRTTIVARPSRWFVTGKRESAIGEGVVASHSGNGSITRCRPSSGLPPPSRSSRTRRPWSSAPGCRTSGPGTST